MKKTNNKQSGKKIRRTLVAFLLMLSFVLTAGTFAYWATAVEGTASQAEGTLTVGSGDNVETVFELGLSKDTGGHLVPAAQVENSREDDATGSIFLAYDIQWLEDENQTQLAGTQSVGQIVVSHDVSIVVDGVELDKDDYENIYELINVLYNENNATELVLDADAVTFGFEITMDEPADQVEYNLIANAEISITFSYVINNDSIVTSDVA